MQVLLDTHVWIWWLSASGGLSGRERAALDALAANGALLLSPISLWEAQMLHAKGRLSLPRSLRFADWLGEASDESVLSLAPLDAGVVIALDALPASFHGDPADRLIVATARALGCPLATHDTAIRRSRAVPIWKP